MPSRFDDLKRLQKMLNDELITREEFLTLKGELLSEAPESAETIEKSRHAPDPPADEDMHASQDLSVADRSTRPPWGVRKETGDLPVGDDAHQNAIDSPRKPTTSEIIGWYPDQDRPNIMARFYDGEAFVGDPRPRRQPGWYPDHSLESGRVRYFDGLNWTDKTKAVSAQLTIGQLSGNHLYKVAFGLGIASLFLGIVFGLLAWTTVAVSGWALYSTNVVRGRWMAWTGLALGLVYSLANAYRNGNLDGLF